jgi:hypothetical protein
MNNGKFPAIVLKAPIEILVIRCDVFLEGMVVCAPNTPFAIVVDKVEIHTCIATEGTQGIQLFLTG